MSEERHQHRKALGDRLVEVRESCQWSQLACAQAMGVALSTYRGYECGIRSPTACAVDLYFRRIKPPCTLQWLITGEGEAEVG